MTIQSMAATPATGHATNQRTRVHISAIQIHSASAIVLISKSNFLAKTNAILMFYYAGSNFTPEEQYLYSRLQRMKNVRASVSKINVHASCDAADCKQSH